MLSADRCQNVTGALKLACEASREPRTSASSRYAQGTGLDE